MWTKNEVNTLIELYPDMYNSDIANILGKTKNSVDSKAFRLKLKKSPELLKKISSYGNEIRIKNGGRDLNYETLKKIASKYKTKIEFIRNDRAAYDSARVKGWLSSICEHMSVVSFSTPQLILKEITEKILNTKASYNNRKILNPYEIDVYYEEFMLGFEFQGIYWHNDNINDEIKFELAKNKNVIIIHIFEYENSRNYETDIKNQLISLLSTINNITNKHITKEDVLNCQIDNIYSKLFNKEELINIAKSYDSFTEFKINNDKVYKRLLKLNLIDEATSHMKDKKIRRHKFSDEYIISIVNNYNNLTDFRLDNLVLYKHIKRVKKEYLIQHLKRKKTYEIKDIINKFKQYNNKRDFIKENPKMYKFIRTNKLTKLIFN